MGQVENSDHNDLVLIGTITKPHGTVGEVKVKPLTDFPSRFKDLKRSIVVSKDGNQNEYAIQNVIIGKNDAIILKFSNINSIAEASELSGSEIAVQREDCVELPPDLYYIFDLVGMHVVLSHGKVIGTIEDIDSNKAQDILIVKTVSGNTVMIPFVKEIVPKVLMGENKVVVNYIEGLFDEV